MSTIDSRKIIIADIPPEDEPERICPSTGTYCTGLFCEDYGCAKQCGIYDDNEDEMP